RLLGLGPGELLGLGLSGRVDLGDEDAVAGAGLAQADVAIGLLSVGDGLDPGFSLPHGSRTNARWGAGGGSGGGSGFATSGFGGSGLGGGGLTGSGFG